MRKTMTSSLTSQGKQRAPLDAIRFHCLRCNGDDPESCVCPACPLHGCRMGPDSSVNPLPAIRSHCLDCAGRVEHILTCTAFKPFSDQPACALWPYRNGGGDVTPGHQKVCKVKAQEHIPKPASGATTSRKTLIDFVGKG